MNTSVFVITVSVMNCQFIFCNPGLEDCSVGHGADLPIIHPLNFPLVSSLSLQEQFIKEDGGPMNKDLGKKVKELRIANHLTQDQVAKALGVTPGYISNVENNRSLMTLRMLTYYAQLTGMSLDYLAGTIDEDYRETSLDRELLALIHDFSPEKKEKLIQLIQLLEEY